MAAVLAAPFLEGVEGALAAFLGVALGLVGEVGAESPLASAIAASFWRILANALAVDLWFEWPASLASFGKSICGLVSLLW